MDKFEKLWIASQEENKKNKERLEHNLKTKRAKNLLPYENRALLALVTYVEKTVSI